MYIALWITILIIAILFSFFNSSTHLFVFACVIYALYYFASWSYKEGSRRWSWLRSLSAWNVVRQRWFTHQIHQGGQWKDFGRAGDTFLFIVHPAGYGISTFLTFGAHGRTSSQLHALQPLIAMPRAFFYVPGLTDVIQWFGGIVHTHDAIAAALSNHRSVVWSPAGPMNHSSYFPLPTQQQQVNDEGALKHMEESLLDNEDIFAWISEKSKACNLYIVPVLHIGEESAYRNYTGVAGSRWWLLGTLQMWCWQRFQYEFPVILSGWLKGVVPRPCRLTTIVGSPISTTTTANSAGKKVPKTSANLKADFMAMYRDIHTLTTNIVGSSNAVHCNEDERQASGIE